MKKLRFGMLFAAAAAAIAVLCGGVAQGMHGRYKSAESDNALARRSTTSIELP